MTIDIRGTNSINKGAQLMLEAATARLSPHFDISAPPIMSAYEVRSRLGLQQTLHEYRWPRAATRAGNLVPERIKERFGLVADNDIEGVVDASGFGYSDSFGPGRSEREAIYGRKWRARGIPKVMLPQAFGPFEQPPVAKWAREVIDQADLVFARDAVSQQFIYSLGVTVPVERCTDFTIGLTPIDVPDVSSGAFAAIVPNMKMVTTGATTHEAYVRVLTEYANACRAHGLDVVFVVHETGDRAIADECAEITSSATFESDDPRKLKGAIAQCDLLIASRFHAVVGGLSQGCPTIALGWSHKYQELLGDFEVPLWIARMEDAPGERVDFLLKDQAGQARSKDRKSFLMGQVDQMWTKTIDVLSRS